MSRLVLVPVLVLVLLSVLFCELPEEAPTPTPRSSPMTVVRPAPTADLRPTPTWTPIPTATPRPVRQASTPRPAAGLDADGRAASTLYKELQAFKDDAEFKQVGFAVCCKYNKWLKRAEALRDKTGPGFLARYEFVPYDIVSLGMSYVMGDYDTDGTKWLEKRIEKGLGLRP